MQCVEYIQAHQDDFKEVSSHGVLSFLAVYTDKCVFTLFVYSPSHM